MMEGKTIEERARYGYTVLHRTQDLIKAKIPRSPDCLQEGMAGKEIRQEQGGTLPALSLHGLRSGLDG